MPEATTRIRQLIDRYAEGNVSRFVQMAGIESVQKLNRLFNVDSRSGKYPSPSTSILTSISSSFPEINSSWLLKGEGDMVSLSKESSNPALRQIEAVPLDLVDETDVDTSKSGMEFRDLDNGMVLMTMTLVPEFAYASYPRGWSDPEYLVELPKYSIVLPKREPGVFRAFEVRGDSMDDGTKYSISHGDVAVGRLVDLDLWDQKLHTNGGTDFIIVTHDGIILKRITSHDVKEGIITCASRNPNKTEFPDFTLRLTEVFELYKIRKIDRDWNRS